MTYMVVVVVVIIHQLMVVVDLPEMLEVHLHRYIMHIITGVIIAVVVVTEV